MDMIANYALKNFDHTLVVELALVPLEVPTKGPQHQLYAADHGKYEAA
jgi:hypothetical protein